MPIFHLKQKFFLVLKCMHFTCLLILHKAWYCGVSLYPFKNSTTQKVFLYCEEKKNSLWGKMIH